MHAPDAISWLSDRVLRITFSPTQQHDTIAHAWTLANAIRAADINAIEDITLAYSSVQVRIREPIAMDPHAAAAVESRVRNACTRASTHSAPVASPRRTIDIPVCYDPDLGLDLEWLAHETRLSIDHVIALHTSAPYHVHFLGFLPGFAYMGDVPDLLRVPRHASPRTRVPAGSVAIAGAQAGIYPSDTPGGWRIVGRTPLTIFNPAREHPSLLQPGDTVHFIRIDRSRFNDLASAPRPINDARP